MTTIFSQFFIFHQMIALQKPWKRFFISSKKLFSFSRYPFFLFSSYPFFSAVSHCLRGWSKKNLKVYDVINCLSKNLVTHFIWYLKKEIGYDIKILSIFVLNKYLIEYQIRNIRMEKSCRKCALKSSPRPLFNFAI